ncbi:MAG: carboxylating nicotinate-nucleotide diphosphorylase [Planctomycetes bacterium]|nr:carboxylating nicotinate-nucleotide diphosphorylase [Planctomycetota bacterium]
MINPVQIAAWLEEDLGDGDITTEALIPPGARARMTVTAKASGVICGATSLGEFLCRLGEPAAELRAVADGTAVGKGTIVAQASADHARLLIAERSYLNLVQRLSGVASATRRLVDAVAHTQARILDTRKTTPGLRTLEKAAVVAGGGKNHRMGLYDEFLIKENHLEFFRACPNPFAAAILKARQAHPERRLIIEVRDLEEFRMALGAGPEVILLDNMSCDEMRRAVGEAEGSGVELEASGGISLETVREIAETGVQRISVGGITHSAPALDLSATISVLG